MTQAIFDNLRTDEQSWNARGEGTPLVIVHQSSFCHPHELTTLDFTHVSHCLEVISRL